MLSAEHIKVSDSKNDLQTHSRSLAIILFDSPYMITYSLLLSYTVSEQYYAVKTMWHSCKNVSVF